ncbi:protein translocase subunit [Coemansia sp. RSA 376]|uniref:Mitochondrial import inner membrane translocase subunit n=2 Tax=Coemansia TaxID=4863 RepID=A0A9W8M6T9_9FUNG|nr:protein translocase subunit [Coemansia sp. S17]KAJ2014389.1 protein translocase subunit [Coemansia sp. S680]KAJ2036827.1 protein translocase subunit [Coemansia sp. S3946]KAJ2050699.1 protein translocase subunit [Coemansia sp. S16]KAJ2072673.1 protein translocase subunit [Coemansia sp. S155-1]KAJ2083641.1 protein translocase subunit [Coemansia sp. S142-1]KAJ2102336.1 protein translocase subunit [Coemansia sp. S100]KAJ2110796.1 protein translocase subunit [Coemansia sp. RSA 922]KAJ2260881.
MSSFGGFNSAASTPGVARKEDVMQQVKQELALANAQELINSINKQCYKMCIPSPGTSLSSSEQASLSRCMDKYLASWDTVSRAYVARVTQENH